MRKGRTFKFALSRDFAKSGDISARRYPGRRTRGLALALGYYRAPLQGFKLVPKEFERELLTPYMDLHSYPVAKKSI